MPGDARREHNARCIVTSQTSIAHATATNDDVRGAVLLVQNGHDAKHFKPHQQLVPGLLLLRLLFFLFLLLGTSWLRSFCSLPTAALAACRSAC